MDTNRRTFERFSLPSRAYVTYDRKCRSDRVVDVSSGGLKLHTKAQLRIGSTVNIFLPLPDKQSWRLCMLKGYVIRQERNRDGDRHVAIAFEPDENVHGAALIERCRTRRLR
ncbi:MAG: PilZ domain-containing protein [Myxococcota bacterium]|nr:PilZ domain-containing protein [Myxococcota bacterium]